MRNFINKFKEDKDFRFIVRCIEVAIVLIVWGFAFLRMGHII